MVHHAVEGPVTDDRTSAFPPSCCCWRGAWRVGLRSRGGWRRWQDPDGARRLPCGAAWRSCAGAGPLPRAGTQLAVDCVLLLGGVTGAGAGRRRITHGRWRPAIGGRPRRESASTSGLSFPVLPCQLWQVVGWVGFLLDVIDGVESALWEGCYPALTLAPTSEANRAS